MRARLFPALAMLVGLTVAFATIEVGLRIAAPDWLRERMRELNAGDTSGFGSDHAWPVVREEGGAFHFVPGSSFMVRHYEFEHSANIDELGGRTTPFAPDSDGMVPFMGDSFTFGIGVPDSKTFVSLLGRRSPSRLVNLGVPGTALHTQLDIVEARHVELGKPPVYVFCLFMGNDLSDIAARHQASQSPRPAGAAEPERSRRAFLVRVNDFVFHNSILKRSYSIQFVRQKLLAILNRGTTQRMNPIFLAMRADTDYLEESIVYFHEELKRLEAMSDRHRFGYAFVLIPDVHQVSPKRLEAKRDYYSLDANELEPTQVTRAITSALTEHGIPYFDLSECLASSGSSEALYFVQDNHFTVDGHERAAACLLRAGFSDALTSGFVVREGIGLAN